MPYRTSHSKRQHFDVLADGSHILLGNSRMFDSTYLVADADSMKVLDEGVVLAVDSTTSKYVPYSLGASYGTGSGTPVCITTTHYDMTYGACPVTGVTHAVLLEDYCVIYGGAKGTISAAVKTALPNILWK